jgi:hypothetical protein
MKSGNLCADRENAREVCMAAITPGNRFDSIQPPNFEDVVSLLPGLATRMPSKPAFS